MFTLKEEGIAKDLGGGFGIVRVLPRAKKRTIGPFIFLDHMGPVHLEPGQGMDVRPHPHIGLATLTYLFNGSILHRDSLGSDQLIEPGAVNLMTAGSGIVHSERSPNELRKGVQDIHGLQFWVALPKEFEEGQASFTHHPKKSIPEISLDGMKAHIISGDFMKTSSPVPARSPTTYVALSLEKGAKCNMPLPVNHELALYVVEGNLSARVSGDRSNSGEQLTKHELGLLPKAEAVEVSAVDGPVSFILFGGLPLPEERFILWNFVSSSKERLEEAKRAWIADEFKNVEGDHERIPFPV